MNGPSSAGTSQRKPVPNIEREQRAAAVYGYALITLVFAKLARSIEQGLRVGDFEHLIELPFSFGEDLVVASCFGAVALGLALIRSPLAYRVAAAVVLALLGLLLPADLVSHRLTGAPLTVQRLRGDEGATLADLELLELDDFAIGAAGMALLLLAITPALRYLGRSALLRRLARPPALAGMLVAGTALHVAGMALSLGSGEISQQAVVELLASAVESSDLQGVALSDSEWRKLLRSRRVAQAPSAPTLPADRPQNAIIFLAEGIDYGHTGFAARFDGAPRPSDKSSLPNPTPNLVRRQRDHGALFARYYANWHASIQAIFSVVCSQLPPLQGDIVRIKPRIDCGQLSEVVRARGRSAGLFHGGTFSFYDKLALLGRRGFATELDAEEIALKSKRKRHEWGIDDRAVVEAALSWIDKQDRSRGFVALIIPITAHYPYWVPRDFDKPFQGMTREQRFLNAVAFQDHVFEQLARGLEQRGLYDDTLLVWLGDHGHYVGEPTRATPGLRGFYEPNLHTPLVLLNSKLFPSALRPEQRVSERLGSHIDLMPTVLHALGLAGDDRHAGQSLLAEDFEPRRVFFGADAGRYVGFIDGDHKLATEVRGKRSEYYDLGRDPDELSDLSKQRPEEVAALRAEVLRFARAVQARIHAAPELSEALSPEQVVERFMEHAAVSLRADDGSVQRCGAEGGRGCDELGVVMRAHIGKVQREARRCVMVSVPPKGELLLDVRDRDTLTLLSSTLAVLPHPPQSDARVVVAATTDGKRGDTETLSPVKLLVRVEHPRPRTRFELSLKRLPSPFARRPDPDAGPEPLVAPIEVCLQLTALVAD